MADRGLRGGRIGSGRSLAPYDQYPATIDVLGEVENGRSKV